MKQRYFDARTGRERFDGDDPMADKKVSGVDKPWRSKTLHQKSATEVTAPSDSQTGKVQDKHTKPTPAAPERKGINDRMLYQPMEEISGGEHQDSQSYKMPPIQAGGSAAKGPLPPAPSSSPGAGGGTIKPPTPIGTSAGSADKNPPPLPPGLLGPPTQAGGAPAGGIGIGPLPPSSGSQSQTPPPPPGLLGSPTPAPTTGSGGGWVDAGYGVGPLNAQGEQWQPNSPMTHSDAKVRVQRPQSTKRIETFGGQDAHGPQSFEQAQPHPTGDEFPTPRPQGPAKSIRGAGHVTHFDRGAEHEDEQYDAVVPGQGSGGSYQEQASRYDGAHPGFAAVQGKIEGEGYSPDQAGAILASKTRNASKSAKKKNPRLNKVKG